MLYSLRLTLSDQAALDREAEHKYPKTGHIRFFFSSYKPEYYFFEILECARKLLMGSVIGIIGSDSTAAPVLGLVISICYIYVVVSFRPFQSAKDSELGIKKKE